MRESDGHPMKTITEALRATDLYTTIGCPEWCSWSVSHPDHEHLVATDAEVVVYPGSEDGTEQLLEVRHRRARGLLEA